jgi:sugar phosphate isomerase/epimerase
MKTIRGPAIFLAQFAGDATPFNNLADIAGWAAGHGYKGVQLPSWDARLFDLARAAESTGYCDKVKGVLSEAGVQLTELPLVGAVTTRPPAAFSSLTAIA